MPGGREVAATVALVAAIAVGAHLMSSALKSDVNSDAPHSGPAIGKSAPAGCNVAIQESNLDTGEDVTIGGPDCASPLRLATTQEDEYSPDLSIDGSKVVFVRSAPDGQTELVTTSVDGSDEKTWVESSELLGGPVWSPDGSSIVFWRNDPTHHVDLWTIDTTTLDSARLTDLNTVAVHPDWSPDGKSLAFSAGDPQGARIGIISSTGGEVQFLSEKGAALTHPSWSPDGSRLAAVIDSEENDGDAQLAVFEVSTGMRIGISRLANEVVDSSWTTSGLTMVSMTGGGAADQIVLDEETLNVLRRDHYTGIPSGQN